MDKAKKPKGWAAKEQKRKQKRVQNNSKKQQKNLGDIGKEEPRKRIKPCEEEGKKALEEYTNDVIEENHSQGTTEHSMPSDQRKGASSCEGRPPVDEGDCKAKGKELEKETNHLKAKHKTLEEKDRASPSTQQSTPCLQEKMVDPCEGQPPEKEEDQEVKDKKLEETKKQCITTMEPGGETMKFGDPRWTDSSLNSSVTKNLRASLEEILPDVGGEDAEVKSRDQGVKCKEGSKLVYGIKGSDVVLRQVAHNFSKNYLGEVLDKAMMTWARNSHPELHKCLPKTKKFSMAVKLCTEGHVEDKDKMLELLKRSSQRFKSRSTGVLKDLGWNKESGAAYFILWKEVATLNMHKFHPDIENDDARRLISDMGSNGQFVYDGVDLYTNLELLFKNKNKNVF